MAHIEIIRTDIAGLSSLSLKSALGIQIALETKHETVPIISINNLDDLETVVARKPDLIFLGLKYILLGSLGKIWLAEYFQNHGIATTGSDSHAHQLELDKTKAKTAVINAGLVTSPFFVVKKDGAIADEDLLSFPMFVKPTNRGGGLGIDVNSVVHSSEQLHAKIASLQLNHGADSLVEQYLSGREFSVAILSDASGIYNTLPIELIAPLNSQGDRLLSAKVKSADAEKAITITDEFLASRINALAISVFHALGARDYGRIDIRLDQDGKPNFLEANLIPSLMENYGSFPKACVLHQELQHAEMILQIAELALTRQESAAAAA